MKNKPIENDPIKITIKNQKAPNMPRVPGCVTNESTVLEEYEHRNVRVI